ncbi:hypothetical protein ZEAMMB73_Zm00001d000217 [Zea mays]|nr:hypothetical protein ZEAMMB73_Zm00001d000217 [Zea mays]
MVKHPSSRWFNDCRPQLRLDVPVCRKMLIWARMMLVNHEDRSMLQKSDIYRGVLASLYCFQADPSLVAAFLTYWNVDGHTLVTSQGEMGYPLHTISDAMGIPISGRLYEEFIPPCSDVHGHLETLYAIYASLCPSELQPGPGLVSLTAWLDHFFDDKADSFGSSLLDGFADPKDPLLQKLRFHVAVQGDRPAAILGAETLSYRSMYPSTVYRAAFITAWLCTYCIPVEAGQYIRPELEQPMPITEAHHIFWDFDGDGRGLRSLDFWADPRCDSQAVTDRIFMSAAIKTTVAAPAEGDIDQPAKETAVIKYSLLPGDSEHDREDTTPATVSRLDGGLACPPDDPDFLNDFVFTGALEPFTDLFTDLPNEVREMQASHTQVPTSGDLEQTDMVHVSQPVSSTGLMSSLDQDVPSTQPGSNQASVRKVNTPKRKAYDTDNLAASDPKSKKTSKDKHRDLDLAVESEQLWNEVEQAISLFRAQTSATDVIGEKPNYSEFDTRQPVHISEPTDVPAPRFMQYAHGDLDRFQRRIRERPFNKDIVISEIADTMKWWKEWFNPAPPKIQRLIDGFNALHETLSENPEHSTTSIIDKRKQVRQKIDDIKASQASVATACSSMISITKSLEAQINLHELSGNNMYLVLRNYKPK